MLGGGGGGLGGGGGGRRGVVVKELSAVEIMSLKGGKGNAN